MRVVVMPIALITPPLHVLGFGWHSRQDMVFSLCYLE